MDPISARMQADTNFPVADSTARKHDMERGDTPGEREGSSRLKTGRRVRARGGGWRGPAA